MNHDQILFEQEPSPIPAVMEHLMAATRHHPLVSHLGGFEPHHIALEPHHVAFETHHAAFEPHHATFEPHHITFESHHVPTTFEIHSSPHLIHGPALEYMMEEELTKKTPEKKEEEKVVKIE